MTAAVLIITCPCALGLAIPTLQTVVSGAMFRAGVLLNSGDAIERLAEVDRIIFDNAGTLTLPELDIVNSASIPPEVFALAGRLALASHIRSPRRWRTPPTPDRRSRTWSKNRAGRSRLHRWRGGEAGPAVILWRRPARKRDPAPRPEVSAVAFSRGEARYVFTVR